MIAGMPNRLVTCCCISSRQDRKPSGFTLVELLVVIAIIGILVALLLPAIQAAREASRRASCTNNVKQLVLALHNHQSTKGVFPPGAVRIPGHPNGEWATTQISWMARILPQIEEQAIYDRIDWEINPGDTGVNVEVMGVPLASFRCPSDDVELPPGGRAAQTDSGHPLSAYAPTNYVTCLGDSDDARGNDLKPSGPYPTGIIWINSKTRFKDIEDGSASTMLVSECLYGAPLLQYYAGTLSRYMRCQVGTDPPISSEILAPRGFSWFYGQQNSSWAFNTIIPPNDTLTLNHECTLWTEISAQAARSRHPGGVTVGMADGSVQFISDSINHETWQHLGSRNDGNIIGTL